MSGELVAQAKQAERVARAACEGGDYTWSHRAGQWIVETAKGSCYVVTAAACSCPDFQYRCSKAGTRCKHQVALGHKLIAEGRLS